MGLSAKNAHVVLGKNDPDSQRMHGKALLYLAHDAVGGESIKTNGTTNGVHGSNGQVWEINYTVPSEAKYGAHQGTTYTLEWRQHNVQDATKRNRWRLKGGGNNL
eukprot:TRINITY_DN114834_c0_g1_i1.p1 TRINITY_DN114834_c0_g1~~TRINITY_DN114834_c0_g1_i1.p1  ORF type:complete len:105 (+),score=1.58 TRINITY_DN114834_c0_g1_i1:67-381(+)